jgi:hypothetical protein
MTTSSSFLDVASYIRPPRVGVASGLSLAKMLLLRVPRRPGKGVLMAAKALATAVVATEAAWKERTKSKPAGGARQADVRLDRAHATVQARLSHYEIFEPARPDRMTSSTLLARLYPDGLGFLKLAWVEEHAESERRLQIVEEEELREDLERLVGEPFVAELFEAHEAYGKALGITEEKQPAPELSMVEPLRMMVQLISDYALQVLAFGKLDPDRAVAARRALAPIDVFRQAASKRGNGGGSAEDEYELPEGAPAPDSPVPELSEELEDAAQ